MYHHSVPIRGVQEDAVFAINYLTKYFTDCVYYTGVGGGGVQ